MADSNGSISDYIEILKALQRNGFCNELNPSSLIMGFVGEECHRLRYLFDKLLAGFLKESTGGSDEAAAARLGSGKVVDLFKLFWAVRGEGGYESVEKRGVWRDVVARCGLGKGDIVVIVAVKLVYRKYLFQFEKLVGASLNGKNVDGNGQVVNYGEKRVGVDIGEERRLFKSDMHGVVRGNSEVKGNGSGNGIMSDGGVSLSIGEERRVMKGNMNGVESEVRGNSGMKGKGVGNGVMSDEFMSADVGEEGAKVKGDMHGVESEVSGKGGVKGKGIENGGISDGGESVDSFMDVILNMDSEEKDQFVKGYMQQFDCEVSKTSGMKHVDEFNANVECRKRKREAFSDMVEWVKEMAKNPGSPEYENLVLKVEHKGIRNLEFKSLLLSARTAMRQGPNLYWSKNGQILQKKHQIHLSMFENDNVQDAGKKRSSFRLLSQNAFPKAPSCGMNGKGKTRATALYFDDSVVRQRVAVGPQYQAIVPEWTGVVTKSDPKWLEKGDWAPLHDPDSNPSVAHAMKSRLDSCCCNLPGSIECVRFHVAENRMKLRLQLGLNFFKWQHQIMGEEVSLSWTEEEEKKFKDIVENKPPFYKRKNKGLISFWNQIIPHFPHKSWRNLVNYYFNVYVLQRRMYQNRATPDNIDSDDDESPFDTKGYGYEVREILDYSTIYCSQNKQYDDIE